MKIHCISDIHSNLLPRIPECDVLAISGDIVNGFKYRFYDAEHWLETNFREWLEEVPARHVVACAGNHDFWAQDGFRPDIPWTYLQDSGVEIDGVKFWGSPWQPPFGWAFNIEDQFAHRYYERIDLDTNVLLSHSPPYGYGDQIGSEHVGSVPLLKRINELRDLSLVVCGHVHVGRGKYKTREGVDIVNASVVDYDYKITHKGFTYEI